MQECARVAGGAEVLEFVRVDDPDHGPNLLSRDVECHYGDQLSSAIQQTGTGLAVHLDRAHLGSGDLEALSHPGHQGARDTAAPSKRSCNRGGFPATIGAQYDTMDPKHMEWMSKQMPKGQYLYCANGSHLAIYDDQQTYMSGLIKFIKSVDASR